MVSLEQESGPCLSPTFPGSTQCERPPLVNRSDSAKMSEANRPADPQGAHAASLRGPETSPQSMEARVWDFVKSPSRGRVSTAAAIRVPVCVLTGLPPLAIPSQQPQQDELGMMTQSEGWRSFAVREAISLCRAVENCDGSGRFRSGPLPELGRKSTEYGIFLAPGSMEGNHKPAEKA